ncbi:hypothetical protein SADUNF_Sadunf06G0065200 [Salix dunnii]|uniref:protein-serine/threonine phosphatase n=1 Tax=Salix dunnii TaxID=1413687 RepID=A0A835K3E1_9ROSI|nr:hypothetical protein SADUNF_Sadunf06G0065200 [Salix dunnii]
MGNGVTKVSHCFARAGDISSRHHIISIDDYGREGLGHSFCYIRPDIHQASGLCSSSSNNNDRIHSELETTTFRSISGASLSANTSTTSSTSLNDTLCSNSSGLDRASTFESSDSFASLPLQPVPRGSGVLSSSANSGLIERGFLSGPIERGFLSGPIDPARFYSGPFDKEKDKEISTANYSTNNKLQGSGFSHAALITSIDEVEVKPKKQQAGLIKTLKRAISNTISRGHKLMVAPMKGVKDSTGAGNVKEINQVVAVDDDDAGHEDLASELSIGSQNLQWAQGKAGEDRVHVVISEERGWIFVGIYDGFNGPDAPDYLLSYLYTNIHKELKGLLWNNNDKFESTATKAEDVLHLTDQENYPLGGHYYDDLKRKQGKNLKCTTKGGDMERWEEKLKLKEKRNRYSNGANHYDVLRALSRALKKTEEAYFETADEMATDNPELALMGSCVLVMLMKGEDVYLMNVGDSRAVLAQKGITVPGLRKGGIQDLEIINEESKRDKIEGFDGDELYGLRNLNSVQLTVDHTTYVDKEVQRIKKEHPDDVSAILNDRVKGYLKVTRAFGVGFLKQPKWNDILLEMFRIDYIGNSPYVTCTPSLYHHRLSPKDRFLILSSDGLYQYFTNQEAVLEVGSFIAAFPEGDPAQHLIEEVLFRAAKNAGMDFHELLQIPQGERRRYHDDVSVIIISLEGRIWRSSL